jgi:hypothetical protein
VTVENAQERDVQLHGRASVGVATCSFITTFYTWSELGESHGVPNYEKGAKHFHPKKPMMRGLHIDDMFQLRWWAFPIHNEAAKHWVRLLPLGANMLFCTLTRATFTCAHARRGK